MLVYCVARSFLNLGSNISFETALWHQLDSSLQAGETNRDNYSHQKILCETERKWGVVQTLPGEANMLQGNNNFAQSFQIIVDGSLEIRLQIKVRHNKTKTAPFFQMENFMSRMSH